MTQKFALLRHQPKEDLKSKRVSMVDVHHARSEEQGFALAALYKFQAFPDYQEKRASIFDELTRLGIKGTLLIAAEGMNGTIAGSKVAIDRALAFLRSLPGFDGLEAKFSYSEQAPFLRLKVRLKKEIVTIGDPAVSPTRTVGTYVEPQDWNRLIEDPEVLLIDTRNDYEVGIGTFKSALDPKTTSFREFPDYIRANYDPAKHKKIAMFCTGGIRCEKASSFMKEEGFPQVYHLKDGILKYLEQIPKEQSLWKGECFVFDDRVSVNHDLEPGIHIQCFGCRRPLTPEQTKTPQYEVGVSCPYCFGTRSAQDRAASRERQKQIELAKQRGEQHLGS